MNDKHTSTPWEYKERKPWGGPYSQTEAYIEGGGLVIVNGCAPGGTEEAKANAAFIVKACNNYEKLLAAAKDALEFMESVEASDFNDGGAETIPQVDDFREVLRDIEE